MEALLCRRAIAHSIWMQSMIGRIVSEGKGTTTNPIISCRRLVAARSVMVTGMMHICRSRSERLHARRNKRRWVTITELMIWMSPKEANGDQKRTSAIWPRRRVKMC